MPDTVFVLEEADGKILYCPQDGWTENTRSGSNDSSIGPTVWLNIRLLAVDVPNDLVEDSAPLWPGQPQKENLVVAARLIIHAGECLNMPAYGRSYSIRNLSDARVLVVGWCRFDQIEIPVDAAGVTG